MNIRITHNWLLDYLETDATPEEIQKYLSLCGPSVEKVSPFALRASEGQGKELDYIYDIEVTSNRVDMASVFGIAQETQAILPQFGKKAKLRDYPLKKYNFSTIQSVETHNNASLQIKIQKPNLCSRFTAIILDNIKIAPSPDFIKDRLTLCDVKSINNIVDISNYLMLSLGQPVHIFDYERIGKDAINHVSTMKMRESKKGEKIITLDGKELTLPGRDIVIEDGEGKLIDLCGIMGGLNSAVNVKTKIIVLFVQTYNPQLIRRTSMLTNQRTVASTYFEKGLDEERVEPTLVYGVNLLEKYAEAKIASQIYDIYPHPYKTKSISISLSDIQRIIGVKISKDKVVKILSGLGLHYHIGADRSTMVLTVPSWRSKDISIKEDIVEEVTRIYGYHNLPNNIQSTVYIKQPKDKEELFQLQSKIKHFLKHLGLNEVMNYSMISKQMIENVDDKPSHYLRIKNSISEEIEYMRRYVAPSLIKNIKDNEGKKENLKFFEIAKCYKPRNADLPIETYQLAIASNTTIEDIKGIIQALLDEVNIKNYIVKKIENKIFKSETSAEILVGHDWLGKFGQLAYWVKKKYKLTDDIFLAEFEFDAILSNYSSVRHYTPINPYAQIKLDLTINQNKSRPYSIIKNLAFKTSRLLHKMELIDVYKNKISLRFYFSSLKRNITEEEAKEELKKIKDSVLKLK